MELGFYHHDICIRKSILFSLLSSQQIFEWLRSQLVFLLMLVYFYHSFAFSIHDCHFHYQLSLIHEIS
jgi:hypothetical protein